MQRVSLALQPFATALFANSPFTNGKLNGYKSYRSHVWLDTDNDRTGMLPFVFEEGFGFEQYVDYLLDIPMYFIIRDNEYINMTKYTFRNFLEKKVLKKIEPNIEDWINHLSTLFPQVRLKQFLEIRSMDACSWDLICSQPAFWIGILYDDEISDK